MFMPTRSTRIDGPPQKRYRSECDDSSMKSPRQLGHGAYGGEKFPVLICTVYSSARLSAF